MHRSLLQRLLASPQRLSWVLWLALLLPAGQVAASWHALSHLRLEAGDASGKPSLHQSHCDLDVTVATVQGGALASALPSLAVAQAQHVEPACPAGSVWVALRASPYESRAPPLALS